MTPPARVVVIGAGFAGLSCATALAGRGAEVTVLEARRSAGGRAGSFVDEAGESIDNGQHLFMACYHQTRRFLARIGAGDRLRFQDRLVVDYVRHGHRARLRCPPLPAPWHMLSGALTLKGPSTADRIALLRAAPAIRRLAAPGALEALEGITVTRWLDGLDQTRGMREWLWHPLAVATLNESPDVAPASLLGRVLVEGFLRDARGSALGLATVGLGDLYTGASARYLADRGGRLATGAAVARLVTAGDRVAAVETREGSRFEADAFVSAVPPAALAKLEVPVAGLDQFDTSPILSVNLWLDRPLSEVAPFDFAGLIGGPVQWLFNKERILRGRARHLSAVISAARDLVGRSNDDLASLVWEAVRAHIPEARRASLARSMVVRERTATFSATVRTEPLRPGHRSPWPNLLLAGDWTERGMPATIETAVRTGHRCAAILCGDPVTA